MPHNSIAARLARSRSGGLRAANGVTWRLSQSRKSCSTIANSEPLIGSMWSSLMIRSSPDLSASRTTAAALPLLALRRRRTSAMASAKDSILPVTLLSLLRSSITHEVIGYLFLRQTKAAGSGGRYAVSGHSVRRARLPRGCYKELKTNRAILLIEGLAAACEVSMADLHHQTRNPDPNARIDAVGWLFSAVAAAIVAVAALIAYQATDTKIANAPVSQIVAR